jgi:regulator of protease activity HflC (stomatin/prohibitin superfamily)
MVKIEAALNYHPVPEKVAELYKTVGEQYMQRIVDPSMQETIKAVVAQYTAEELVTKRELVRVAIGKLLTEKLDPHGIRVEAFNIVDFDFSGAFNAAIEAKVTAEQQALAAKNKLAQVEFEAQQKVAEAKGKAEAMRVESEALAKTPQILELRALEKWDGKLPHVTGGTIPFINVDQKESTEATVARRLAR